MKVEQNGREVGGGGGIFSNFLVAVSRGALCLAIFGHLKINICISSLM